MTSEDTYTHGHHDSVLRSHRWRTAENSAAYLLPHLRPGLDLLDVGCGPGTLTVDLARRVAPGRVVGVDVSPEVVEEARRLGGDAVAFEVGDFRTIEGRFDVVHAHQVLQHLTDPVGALRAMAGLTRPGGVVAARDSDYRAFAWYPQLPELDRWMELYQVAARANGGEPDAGRRLHAWARTAGFEQVTSTTATWCFTGPDDRAYWGGMWEDRILTSALAEQLLAEGRATRAELEEISTAWRAWTDDPDGWIALLHGEIIATA